MTATLKMIHDHSIPIVKGPLQIEGKVTWLYVTDPDNNVIEFVQWLEQ
jgi:lactoylglutathione lyase